MSEILVIRKFDQFSKELETLGWSVLNLPLIQTETLKDLSDYRSKISRINEYNGVFLTSSAATKVFLQELDTRRTDVNAKVYVFGKSSYDLLKNRSLTLVYDESIKSVKEMLRQGLADDLNDGRILSIRGTNSLRTIAKYFRGLARVDETIVYETKTILPNPFFVRQLETKFEKGSIDLVCFFSPSGAEAFLKRFGTSPFSRSKIAVIGETTAAYLRDRNQKADCIAKVPTLEGYAKSVVEFLTKAFVAR